jgi:hypothetical protein
MRRFFYHRAARALWGSLAGLVKATSHSFNLPVCLSAQPVRIPACLPACQALLPTYLTYLPACLLVPSLSAYIKSVCLYDCLNCQTAWISVLFLVQTDLEFSTEFSVDKMKINRHLGKFLQLPLIPRQITFNINRHLWLIVARKLVNWQRKQLNFFIFV